jgi:hypothetical protein
MLDLNLLIISFLEELWIIGVKKGIENELPKMLKLRYVRFRLKVYAVSKLYTKGIGLCVLLSRKINSILSFCGFVKRKKRSSIGS